MLARRTGATVVCGYCERTGTGRFRITIEPGFDPAAFPSAHALNAAVAETSSRHIREHLDQWCIFRPLWEPSTVADADPAPERRRVTA